MHKFIKIEILFVINNLIIIPRKYMTLYDMEPDLSLLHTAIGIRDNGQKVNTS